MKLRKKACKSNYFYLDSRSLASRQLVSSSLIFIIILRKSEDHDQDQDQDDSNTRDQATFPPTIERIFLKSGVEHDELYFLVVNLTTDKIYTRTYQVMVQRASSHLCEPVSSTVSVSRTCAATCKNL
jgi:hypothetical protein